MGLFRGLPKVGNSFLSILALFCFLFLGGEVEFGWVDVVVAF